MWSQRSDLRSASARRDSKALSPLLAQAGSISSADEPSAWTVALEHLAVKGQAKATELLPEMDMAALQRLFDDVIVVA